MPLRITESNQRVAMVYFSCDRCGQMFEIQLMLKTQIEAKEGTEIVCQQCRGSAARAKN